MAEEDLTRFGGRASSPYGCRPSRSALRRIARVRQRRRWIVEALAAFACLAALVAYLGAEQHAGSRQEESGVRPGPAPGAGRPAVPSTQRPGADADAASPGLRPRQRPPSPSPSPSRPAVEPVLTVTQADVPARVDLTAAGPVDWVQWGLLGADRAVRKRNGSGAIRDEGGRGRRESYSNNPEAYAWRDGATVGSASGTTSGVYTCGRGNGFVLAVNADGELRTVRLYAGLWMARGRLDLRLSTGGPTSTRRLEDPHTQHTAEFTIRFRAPQGAKLLVHWTVEESLGDCGNVSVQAVALR
ncbi:hypothetical protein [Micromonospora inositola]|uniref:Uncharacterized protein n=1 Tax=Micromonospora inositola TaxID=47865 RepID=A0A1C5H039_9ACTN|nr:hypothetical protein [Micromonospora inositola]SCG39227.1 hypothetical protein GA0070613_0620 [Micromonospora inositola]